MSILLQSSSCIAKLNHSILDLPYIVCLRLGQDVHHLCTVIFAGWPRMDHSPVKNQRTRYHWLVIALLNDNWRYHLIQDHPQPRLNSFFNMGRWWSFFWSYRYPCITYILKILMVSNICQINHSLPIRSNLLMLCMSRRLHQYKPLLKFRWLIC